MRKLEKILGNSLSPRALSVYKNEEVIYFSLSLVISDTTDIELLIIKLSMNEAAVTDLITVNDYSKDMIEELALSSTYTDFIDLDIVNNFVLDSLLKVFSDIVKSEEGDMTQVQLILPVIIHLLNSAAKVALSIIDPDEALKLFAQATDTEVEPAELDVLLDSLGIDKSDPN